MTTYSVLNCDARYTVEQELVLVFMECWTARFEDEYIGSFANKTLAEHACKWHHAESLCLEEAV